MYRLVKLSKSWWRFYTSAIEKKSRVAAENLCAASHSLKACECYSQFEVTRCRNTKYDFHLALYLSNYNGVVKLGEVRLFGHIQSHHIKTPKLKEEH